VRIAGLIEGPFDHFCSIGKEVQLVKTWMPGVKISYVVANLNMFDQVGYYCWKFPLVSSREFLIEESTIINDEEGYCLVNRFPPVAREGVKLPPKEKHSIRAAISNWCSFCAPIGKKSNGSRAIFAITVMNVDLKIPLPTRLVNYLSVSMGYQSFVDVRKHVKKSMEPTSPFYKSVADPRNGDYYSRMKGLEKAREDRPCSCAKEILETGWVKDPVERRKLFARSDVLVPLST